MSLIRSLIVFPLILSATAHAEIITGRVVGLADGDTLTILDATNQQHKIRLAGIDAPEKNQDFGQKSKTSLAAMAFNQSARADCRKRDRYQREICVVFVEGKDVGLEQVRAGMAWWYRQYAKEQTAQESSDYEQAELMAKLHRYGLWDSKNPTPPWDWRHGQSGY